MISVLVRGISYKMDLNENEKQSAQSKTYGFVILHYVAYEMTTQCVDTLVEHFSGYNIHIVIVDNASPNGTGEKLLKYYASCEEIDVLLNQENEGFARGNNLGYDYLNQHYNLDYIIVMNNDVIIEQDEFLELIEEANEKYEFDVLGPDIFCPLTGKHQNPAYLEGYTKETLKAVYERTCGYVRHPAFSFYRLELRRRLVKLKHKITRRIPAEDTIDKTKMLEGAVLHGACYIFSRNFINKRNCCFCPDTFLYFEEDILHYECGRDGLKMVYEPQLKVNHMEDVSTNAVFKSRLKKFNMQNKYLEQSMEVMKRMMDND